MKTHPNERVQSVTESIAEHMDDILNMFKPGYRITVLMRNPERPDGANDMLVTNDTIPAIIQALTVRMNSPPGSFEGEV